MGELHRLLIEQGYRGTVGVVTPFRPQANLITQLVNRDEQLSARAIDQGFISEAAHSFQGDERDVMLFSPVVAPGATQGAEGFLNGTQNLFNVSVTRARATLVVVGDAAYCRQCSVSVLRDFVQYVSGLGHSAASSPPSLDKLGPEYPTVLRPEDVSDWERHFYRVLYRAGIRTIPQYPEEKYRLDLALFNGTRRLDIEVDGEHHRDPWTGEACRRDLIRNERLIELGWDVMRFWVYQLRDDMDWCVARVRRWAE